MARADGRVRLVVVGMNGGRIKARLEALEREMRGVRESLDRLVAVLEEGTWGSQPSRPELAAAGPLPLEKGGDGPISAEKADLMVETALHKVLAGIFD